MKPGDYKLQVEPGAFAFKGGDVQLVKHALRASIDEALRRLTEKEAMIIKLRFGMHDGKEHTLAEIGRTFKLSAERIRQIEARALRKLAHSSLQPKLREPESIIPQKAEDEKRVKLAEFPVELPINFISTDVYEELIRHFARNPDELKRVDRRKLEEIIAELFDGFGYEVELTKRTRDGGRDIIAIKEKGTEVAVKYLIEAKRPDFGTPIRVGAVRELYGVKVLEKATKAVLATTTHFTRDANILFEENRWELEPRDFDGIMSWINDYLRMIR
jgi:restriction endonuclease Mrr